MHIKTHFQDDHYILAAFRTDGDDYVLLYDAKQRSSFLGKDEQAVDLAVFWQKHLEDETYCIPCELMLYLDEHWIAVPDESPLEMGIDTNRARALMELLGDEIPAVESVLLNFSIEGGEQRDKRRDPPDLADQRGRLSGQDGSRDPGAGSAPATRSVSR